MEWNFTRFKFLHNRLLDNYRFDFTSTPHSLSSTPRYFRPAMTDEILVQNALHLGDNTLILGHRLGQWCGHGPVLEQDIAMTNIALDLIGQARLYYDLAASIEGNKTQDDYAFLRDSLDFKNLLLTELPNGDFADTIARQFLFDQWHTLALHHLAQTSSHAGLAAIAAKSLKEADYHLRWSAGWVVRLGDGTPESHERMQRAINDCWPYTGEAFSLAPYQKDLFPDGLRSLWLKEVSKLLSEATLFLPPDGWMQSGGKTGHHTEYLGFILAEMQFLPRAYPDAKWH